MARAGILGLLLLSLLTGCGGDEDETATTSTAGAATVATVATVEEQPVPRTQPAAKAPPAPAKTTPAAPTATVAEQPEPNTGAFAGFAKLSTADADLQAATTALQTDVIDCTAQPQQQIQACFARRYRPYGRTVARLLSVVDDVQQGASSNCVGRLKVAAHSVRELRRAAGKIAAAFRRGPYVEDVDRATFAITVTGYRRDMDDAIQGC